MDEHEAEQAALCARYEALSKIQQEAVDYDICWVSFP